MKKLSAKFGKASRMRYIYGGYYKQDVDHNLALFESFHGKEISDSPLALAGSLLSDPEYSNITIYFSSNDLERDTAVVNALGLNIQLVHIHSNMYARLLATAGLLVNNSSFPSYFVKKEDQKYLQTWHGTPLKTLGKKMPSGIETMYNVQHNFLQASYLLFPNEFTRKAIMRDYNLDKLYTGKVVMSGYPRNSIFCDKDAAGEIKSKCGDADITTFAYMPTWRGSDNRNINTSSYAEELKSILESVDNALSDKQKMYVNLHPTVRNSISIDSYQHIFPFPNSIEKYAFINSMDVLITDYSSIFFDYSITGKPIILFTYDYENYISERGMYFDINELPFCRVHSTEQLVECIRNSEYDEYLYSNNVDYVSRFIPYDSIDASEKLLHIVLNGFDDDNVLDYSSNTSKPWNLVTYAGTRTGRDLDAFYENFNPEEDIALFYSSDYDRRMSVNMHDNYADTGEFIFATRSIPMSYAEKIGRKFIPSVRSNITVRNRQRLVGSLYIAQNKRYVFRGVRAESVRSSGRFIYIQASCPSDIDSFDNVIVKFRNDVDIISHKCKYRTHLKNNRLIIDIEIDTSVLESGCTYWDCLVYLVDKGISREYQIALSKKQSRMFALRFIQCEYDGFITFPHVTLGRNIALTHRKITPYDNRLTRFKEICAFAAYKGFGKHWSKRKIWLVFEKFCSAAQDNGFYFFRYCMESLSEEEKKNIFYVIDKSSKDYHNVEPYSDNVLQFMSFRHLFYSLVANLYVGSDSKKHLYTWRAKPNLISGKMRYKDIHFLQHGVTALKRDDIIFGINGSSPMTSVTATSKMEQDILVENWGYSPADVPVLGFTRWDVLHDTSTDDEKIILVMPTWRSWLEERTAEDFLASDYFCNYMELLKNRDLLDSLEKNNVKLTFFIHPKFKDYLSQFSSENKHIEFVQFGSAPLNKIMMDCSMLITDYSSVCWDVYYMGKPVIFYQFDYDMYMQNHGSYIDMENGLFSDRCTELDVLVEKINYYISNGFKASDYAMEHQKDCFAYIDDDNSKRTYEYLKNRGY